MSEKIKVKPYKKPSEYTTKLKIEAYEKNLKLNLEAKRKDFDNLTTSVVPNQINLIKTYLWISSLSFSILILLFTKTDHAPQEYALYSLSIGAILGVLIIFTSFMAMHKTKNKHLAHLKEEDFLMIAQDKWEHTNGLLKMIEVTNSALAGVSQTVTQTGKWLRASIWLMIPYILMMAFGITLHFTNTMKGGINMAEEPKLTRPTISTQPTTQTPVLQANSRVNESTKSDGHRVTADSKPKQSTDNNSTKK